MKVYYFGCVGEVGHYLWDENLKRFRSAAGFSEAELDTAYCPGANRSSPGAGAEDQDEGLAKITHAKGATILSFWDRSVDSRKSSHSTFVIEGEHDFKTACAIARNSFPSIWARYSFEMKEASCAAR